MTIRDLFLCWNHMGPATRVVVRMFGTTIYDGEYKDMPFHLPGQKILFFEAVHYVVEIELETLEGDN